MLSIVAIQILRALMPEDQAAELIQKEMTRAQLFIERKPLRPLFGGPA